MYKQGIRNMPTSLEELLIRNNKSPDCRVPRFESSDPIAASGVRGIL